MIKRILLGFLFLSAPYGVVAKNLPLPSFPANFKVAEYQGQKGCIPKVSGFMTAVAENSSTKFIGSQLVMQSPKNGKYHVVLQYSETTDVGYILVDKQDGKLCVIDTISKFSYKKVGSFKQVDFQGEITDGQCNQINNRFDGICGSFKTILKKLQKNGFELQFQAKNEEGNILSILSGNGKTYELTTDRISNATVLTGASVTSEFKWIRFPSEPNKRR
jgi:hypothetical protein